jgi:predicted RNA-binding Zn ribbon-like protein
MEPEPPFQPGGRVGAPAPLDLIQDFVNSEIPDFDRDDIATPVALAAWLGDRGLLTAGARVTPPEHARAIALRRALRLLALAHTRDVEPTRSERALIDSAVRAIPVQLASRGAGLRVEARGRGTDAVLAGLLAVVVEAERDGSWQRFKACAKHGCGWAFYDASRNRSSTWCSMRICGNRTKVAALRTRARAERA